LFSEPSPGVVELRDSVHEWHGQKGAEACLVSERAGLVRSAVDSVDELSGSDLSGFKNVVHHCAQTLQRDRAEVISLGRLLYTDFGRFAPRSSVSTIPFALFTREIAFESRKDGRDHLGYQLG